MGKQSKRPSRRDYLNDFHPTADGGFVYTGTHLRWASTNLSRKRAMAGFWSIAMLQTAALIVCGSIPAPGMLNCAWVILPYIVAAAVEFLLMYALIRLTSAGDPVREYIHRKTVRRFPALTGACMVFCGLSLLTEILYLVLFGWGDHGISAIVFLFGQGLQILCAFLWRSLNGRIRWQST